MSFEPRDYLRHMLAEADYLIAHSAGLTREEFLKSDTDVVHNRIPELDRQIASMLEA